jgi:hypothetical protein
MKRWGFAGHYQARRSRRKILLIDIIALLITAAVIVVMVLWVPLLDLIGPPCARYLQRRRNQWSSSKVPFSTVSPKTYAE